LFRLKLMNPHLPLLCSVAVLLQASPALAWGDIGHRVICEITFEELEAPARERVKAMIRQDPSSIPSPRPVAGPTARGGGRRSTMSTSRRDAPGFDEDPCPHADECVVSAIEKDLSVLSSSSGSQQEQLEALKYLGHWVGDIHQPLHMSFEDDRGGKRGRRIRRSLQRDLHAAWDSCLIERGLAVLASAGPTFRDNRPGPGDMAGLHADGLGERIVCDLGQPGAPVLRPQRNGLLVRAGQ
jgi:S1/P1 Nuclease